LLQIHWCQHGQNVTKGELELEHICSEIFVLCVSLHCSIPVAVPLPFNVVLECRQTNSSVTSTIAHIKEFFNYAWWQGKLSLCQGCEIIVTMLTPTTQSNLVGICVQEAARVLHFMCS
jgi:hypothetical protein